MKIGALGYFFLMCATAVYTSVEAATEKGLGLVSGVSPHPLEKTRWENQAYIQIRHT